MGDKLELNLRITLDRNGLRQHLGREVENDVAFFVLGMVNAHLTSLLSDEHCQVDMQSATGLDPVFVRSMNGFTRKHKRALEVLDAQGEVVIEDRELLEVFQELHDVMVTPLGGRWRVARSPLGECGPA